MSSPDDLIKPKGGTRGDSGDSLPLQEIERVLAATAGLHPGIITESVVARLMLAYDLIPREAHHREQRKNHEERIRRFSHEVYRVLADAAELDPAREIAARVTKAFILARKGDAGQRSPGGGLPRD